MLTGPTSTLRSLPVLSSCGLSRNPARLVTRRFVAPPPSGISTSHYPQRVPAERSGSASHATPTTSSEELSSVRLLSSQPTVPIPINATTHNRPSIFSGMAALSAAKSSLDHLTGVDSVLDIQTCQRQEHVLPTQRPHKVAKHTKRKCPAQRRRTLLWVMLTTKSPERAWVAYQKLLSYGAVIPRHLLHQLVRLLASIKPRTRTVHLQILSVLKTLERNHGQLRLWEWNTLIDSAGKHWHKTRLEDYEHAFDIFNKRGVLSIGYTAATDEVLDAEADPCVAQQDPDIWTYNILLSIASRSNSPLAVRHASSLLLTSGLSPNRHTHLCLLRYFAFRNDLRSVRSTLRKMDQQGLEIGLDGINACLWAYARNRRFDVALPIYRLLRNNVKPTPNLGEYHSEEDACYVRDAVGLDVPCNLEPDEITYTMMIQTLAYHGDMRNALGVFVDMLSTPNREANARADTPASERAYYKPSMAAFRGLFLGFARHGRGLEHRTVDVESVATLFRTSQAAWDEDTLETVFAAFLQLPSLPKPTERLLYWILIAFDKTSGNDTAKLREVWTKLETKYGGGWGGRLEEIRKSIFGSDDRKT